MTPLPRVLSATSALLTPWLPARRRKEGICYVEGEKVVREALAGSWALRALLLEEHFAATPDGEELQARALERRLAVHGATQAALDRLTDCGTAPPAGLVLEPPAAGLPAAPPPRVLVLDRLTDPGNVGTLVRCAAAFGFGVVLTEGGLRLGNEKMLRATAGTIFQPGVFLGFGPADGVARWLGGREAYVLDPHAGEDLRELRVLAARPLALVLGSEAHGIEASAWPGVRRLRIALRPGVESLNVAMAGAIALHALAAPEGSPQINP